MKDLKFRVWDTELKEFVQYGHILFSIESGTVTVSPLDPKYSYEQSNTPFSERFVVSQYTGLKDKNGNELYEGDILLTEYNGHLLYSGAVYVIPSTDKVLMDYDNVHPDYRSDVTGLSDKCLVGNIWEHPEYLEEDENSISPVIIAI